ncbi:LysR substrate-binding domain-containing protein [Massilia sp. H-1]|nr:LysR substrate-binding domain-containing protein [Massilia sp. H-1]
MEADIGAQLFERTKRSVRLTGAGQLFLADARRILALADEATDTARRAQRGEAGELRIGFTFSTPLTPLFATVINRYRQQYPAVSLKLHEMATLPQLEALAQRSLDLGFVRPPETPPGPGIALDALREDQLVAVLLTASPLARGMAGVDPRTEGHAVRDVSARRLSTGIYPQIFRLCRAAGFTPERSATWRAKRPPSSAWWRLDCGVSVLPSAFTRIHMDGVCYRPLTDAGATTTLLLARRSDDSNALIDAFVALATAAADE